MNRFLFFSLGVTTTLFAIFFIYFNRNLLDVRDNCTQKYEDGLSGYCKNGNRVFFIDGQFSAIFHVGLLHYVGKFPSDPGTFVDLGSGFGKDSVQVYDRGYPVGSTLSIDSQSFELLRVIKDNERPIDQCQQYSKDRLHVFFSSCNPDSLGQNPMLVVENADPSTFHVIGVGANGSVYGSDIAGVYYSGREVEDSDPASFSTVSRSVGGCEYDALDKFHIFWAGAIVDPSRAKYGECSNQ